YNPIKGETGLGLISDVAAAAGLSNTRRSLTTRIAETLARHLPLVDFELVWPDKSDETFPGSRGPHVVIVPPGIARLSFVTARDASVQSHDLLEALGRVLSFAQHHCIVVERVAKLSSAAHHNSQELRDQLRRFVEPDRIVAR